MQLKKKPSMGASESREEHKTSIETEHSPSSKIDLTSNDGETLLPTASSSSKHWLLKIAELMTFTSHYPVLNMLTRVIGLVVLTVLSICVFVICSLYVLLVPKSVASSGSITSLVVALLRAHAAVLGLCDDTLALYLLPLWPWQIMALMMLLLGFVSGLHVVNSSLPGRCAFGDEAVSMAADADMEQIVILGAGNDTRLHRLKNLPVHVFEIDAPKTQQGKLARLRSCGQPYNAHVQFIPVNFETQSWMTELQAHHFDVNKKTLFIWEGVSYYLTDAAIRFTLEQVSRCASGSRLVMDYGHIDPNLSLLMALPFQLLGEPWVSSFTADSLGQLLAEYHLALDFAPIAAEEAFKTVNEASEQYRGKVVPMPIYPLRLFLASATVK